MPGSACGVRPLRRSAQNPSDADRLTLARGTTGSLPTRERPASVRRVPLVRWGCGSLIHRSVMFAQIDAGKPEPLE